jgi:cytidylate kinase
MRFDWTGMIVTIDGPAGSGKSTIAKALAERLHMRYLDTGAMYRAVALAVLEAGLPLDDEAAVAPIARAATIVFEHEGDSAVPTRVVFNGVDVTTAIRTPDVDAAVSAVSRLPGVRDAMVRLQREIGAQRGLVAEGRDVGTVVFPDAEVKVFLTAEPGERARRRHQQLERRGESLPAEEVHAGILARDTADSTREASPLTPAPDAVTVDTTRMTVDEVVAAIEAIVSARTRGGSA